MADEQAKKPDLKLVPEEELDEEEQEFRAIRQDVPGVKGASAIGIVTIGVGKTPGRNEFFRTHLKYIQAQQHWKDADALSAALVP